VKSMRFGLDIGFKMIIHVTNMFRIGVDAVWIT